LGDVDSTCQIERMAVMAFRRATVEEDRALVMRVCGHEKEGKTHFGLTAPDPINVHNIDHGLAGVVGKFVKEGKIINVAEYEMPDRIGRPDKEVAVQAGETWKQFQQDLYESIRDPKVKSILLDKETEFWALLRVARFGKLEQVPPNLYVLVNAEYTEMTRRLKHCGKNVIYTQKLKKVYTRYKNAKGQDVGEWNGQWEPAGFGDLGYDVQETLMSWKSVVPAENKPAIIKFGIKVLGSTHAPQLQGQDLMEPMNTFPWVASMLMEGTTPEDWGGTL